MKDSSKEEKNMGLENTFGKILVIMKEIGFPIWWKGMEHFNGLTGGATKENGGIIWCMVKGHTNGPMEGDMRANITIT